MDKGVKEPIGWYGASLCIKAKDYHTLKGYLLVGDNPDRVIEVACREIAIDEGAGGPEEVKARTRDLVERAQAGLRALEAGE